MNGLLFLTIASALVAFTVALELMAHPPASETVNILHKKLTAKHMAVDFAANVQALIDRVLLRAGVNFQFRPVIQLIDYEVVDDQLMDVFEIDQQDNQVVLRLVK